MGIRPDFITVLDMPLRVYSFESYSTVYLEKGDKRLGNVSKTDRDGAWQTEAGFTGSHRACIEQLVRRHRISNPGQVQTSDSPPVTHRKQEMAVLGDPHGPLEGQEPGHHGLPEDRMSHSTQGHHPLQFKNAWRRFVSDSLRSKRLTKRALCKRAGIDPSYVTLFCRDGYIPKRDVVERVGLALGSIDEALRAAGYLEDGAPHDKPSLAGLSEESMRLLSSLASLLPEEQDRATLTLRLALPAMLAQKCRPEFHAEVA